MKHARSVWLLVSLALFDSGASWAADEPKLHAELSLKEAVEEALKNNPEIHAARMRLAAANARVKQAPYLEDPELALQAGGVPFSTPTNFNRADANMIGIRQKLPFYGKLGLKEKIARQEAKVLEQELRAKEREILARVKMAYGDLFMAEKAIEITLEQSEIIRSIGRASEARYQVGKVTQQDVFKALLEQTAIMNQLAAAEHERHSAEIRLNASMNRPVQTPIRLAGELTPADGDLPEPAVRELALASRAELKGAEQEIERSERMYELAERNRKFPDFMVGWDYWYMPMEMTKNRYAAMVNISIPFSPWTAGRRHYEVEESLAEIRAAKANRESIRNMTLREVGESQARVQAARRSLELYREGIVPQADLSFRTALSAYQAGRVEFISLLESQRALREARMGYFKALVSLMQSVADLERAVGKELQ